MTLDSLLTWDGASEEGSESLSSPGMCFGIFFFPGLRTSVAFCFTVRTVVLSLIERDLIDFKLDFVDSLLVGFFTMVGCVSTALGH